MKPDLYSILEISKNASEQDIKKAYRKLTLQYHPDRNNSSDADEKIRKINEAYEILGDKEKRSQYDSEPFHAQGIDIFNMFFNGGGIPFHSNFNIFHNGVRQYIKPAPILHTLTISLEQSFKGCSFQLKIDRTNNSSSSVSYETETFQISIPAGVDDEKFIIEEKGNVYENCKGDIVVSIQIEYIFPFSRRGKDLIYSKNVTLKESLCGFSFDILHPSGETITIEEHSVFKPGSKKIIAGMGMRKEQQWVGDLIIEFSVDFPESLTIEQVELLRTIL
uniref:J domain-containing protein n=1 Tax=viral metagenome TaxID=1070528 RepID=A0A6C0H3I3_9ZZZZ